MFPSQVPAGIAYGQPVQASYQVAAPGYAQVAASPMAFGAPTTGTFSNFATAAPMQTFAAPVSAGYASPVASTLVSGFAPQPVAYAQPQAFAYGQQQTMVPGMAVATSPAMTTSYQQTTTTSTLPPQQFAQPGYGYPQQIPQMGGMYPPTAGYGMGMGAGMAGGRIRTLLIRPMSAQLSHDTEFIGKMDPQVEFTLGTMKYRSSVAMGGGKAPKWNDSITHTLTGAEQTMHVVVYDVDKMRKNDLIGETYVPINDTLLRGGSSNWYDLTYQGRPAGRILINMEVVN